MGALDGLQTIYTVRLWVSVNYVVMDRAHEDEVVETMSLLFRLTWIIPRLLWLSRFDMADSPGDLAGPVVHKGMVAGWKCALVAGQGEKTFHCCYGWLSHFPFTTSR